MRWIRLELAAALVWARNHLENPADWETLEPTLLTTLSFLYSIPKPQRDAPHLSAMERLAQQIQFCFTPTPSHTSLPQGGSFINIALPRSSVPGPSGSTALSGGSQLTTAQATSGAMNVQQQPVVQAPPGAPLPPRAEGCYLLARLSLSQLQQALPPFIFRALDSDLSRSLPVKEKYTFVKMQEHLGQAAMKLG
jgi:hypothetical protein